MSQSRAPKEKTRTGPTPYLVPGRDGASETHEQVGHGHETNPYHHGEKAEQPLKHRLDADEDENREENRQGGGDCDQKGQMVFNFLRGDKVTKTLQKHHGSSDLCDQSAINIHHCQNALGLKSYFRSRTV